MDRARVLCPSISLAAHCAGAAILATAPLLLPGVLPETGRPGGLAPGIDREIVASLGRGVAARPVRVAPVRVDPPPSRVVLPTFVTPLPIQPNVDLTEIPGIEGIPADPSGQAGRFSGFCLLDCVGGRGDGRTDGVLPVAEEPKSPVRVRVGGSLREPRKLRHVAPVYPPLAMAAHVEGRVVLDCVIDEEGRVSSVDVLQSNPLLEAAAVEAVRQWRYTPTLLNGVRVGVLLTVTVDFHLR